MRHHCVRWGSGDTCFRIHSAVVIDIGIAQRASSDSITTYTNGCYRSALQAGSVVLSEGWQFILGFAQNLQAAGKDEYKKTEKTT